MTTPAQVDDIAQQWLGTSEQPAFSNQVPGITDWYGMVGRWCAMFVSRVFYDAGLPLAISTSKGFAYTPTGANWFREAGRWHQTPLAGDVVFFDFPGDGVDRISHVGIVRSVLGGGAISTVEGNTDAAGSATGGSVLNHTRRSGIVGFGRPDYQGDQTMPLTSADHLGIQIDVQTVLDRNAVKGTEGGFKGSERRTAERLQRVERVTSRLAQKAGVSPD